MTTFRWVTKELPAGISVRQVYGWCFAPDGRVLLRNDGSRFGLPGGRPEPAEDHATTLARECEEESQITISSPTYLGYQEVTEHGEAPYAQLRFIARIADFAPRHPDPDTGRIYRRLITPINKAPALLDWGLVGLLQAASAATAAIDHFRIDPDTFREDTYHD